MTYNDGLIPNDNLDTLYPEVLPKHDPVYYLTFRRQCQTVATGIPARTGRIRTRNVRKARPTILENANHMGDYCGPGDNRCSRWASGGYGDRKHQNLGNHQDDVANTNVAVTGNSNTALSSPTLPATSETIAGTGSTTAWTTTTKALTPVVTTPTPSVPIRTVDSPSGLVTMECPGVDGLDLDVSSPSRGSSGFSGYAMLIFLTAK
ncbi:hypothetical protein QBC41DRAFT_303778 [Cercophora samala]|uniref:Uncharacterized protein n=1 Tax=Cercophora samala TaxID=330535 RepID=A0AA39ZBV1_9PEZI|nr:hypothetical protein QBC41DRAFT_303778 [Cercophora samala]